jgi:phage-related baseplate assembly protein
MANAADIASLLALRQASPPEFIERDPSKIKEGLVAAFEALTDRTLYPAQVEMFMIDTMSYALSNVGSAVQAGLLQNRAIWAEGQHLDGLGANVNTYRLGAQHAVCEVQFTLTESRLTAVIIPLNTRVSAGSSVVFSTLNELIIPAGELTGTVGVTALESGALANDLMVGQIKDILDPIAYVSLVSNITVSGGGSDVEGDIRFFQRVANAFERISRGGSYRGYIELVLAAHPDIIDVHVLRAAPGYIGITLLTIGGVASDAIDQAVIVYLDPETRIPMGDFVSVGKAAGQVFDVVMTLKVTAGMAASVAPAAAQKIRDQFDNWGQVLGAQIAPSALVEAVRSVAGVVGVTGPEFDFTDLNLTSFAILGELTIDTVEVSNA